MVGPLKGLAVVDENGYEKRVALSDRLNHINRTVQNYEIEYNNRKINKFCVIPIPIQRCLFHSILKCNESTHKVTFVNEILSKVLPNLSTKTS